MAKFLSLEFELLLTGLNSQSLRCACAARSRTRKVCAEDVVQVYKLDLARYVSTKTLQLTALP